MQNCRTLQTNSRRYKHQHTSSDSLVFGFSLVLVCGFLCVCVLVGFCFFLKSALLISFNECSQITVKVLSNLLERHYFIMVGVQGKSV